MKRKQFELMKNDLRVELTKLTIDSGKLNIDIQEAKLDFQMMCKAMADRQAEFMSSALFLEEKYGASIAVLEGKVVDGDGEGSSANVVLPRSYENSIKRFVEDSGDSLYHHGVLRTAEIKEIGDMFAKYNDIWNQNMKEMKEMAQKIEKQRVKLDIKLTNFNQAVLSDDEDFEEDDEEESEEEDEEVPEEEDEEEHEDEEDN